MTAVQELAGQVGVKAACAALGVARATFYRRRRPRTTGQRQSRPKPARALSEAERGEVFDVLCSPRFADRAPAEVYATLLDEGVHLCSERTMYRILGERRAVRERRAQRSHPNHPKPEVVARAPNEAWSWDVTRLQGPKKGRCLYLYVILDIFSRYVTGWMVAERETAGLAGRLIEEGCLRHGVRPEALTLHSDRGAPMTAKCTAQLLADLGVTQSLGRPRVSNDNPYSEAQFKTVKYHPGFPGRFADIEEAKTFCRSFFTWYNTEHRHGGIGLLTPEQVHLGRASEVIRRRQEVLAGSHTGCVSSGGCSVQHPILVDCFLTEEDQDAAVQDLALIVNAVEARDDHAVALILERQSKTGPIRYSPERHAIQFLGCRGGVVWHVPLPSTVGIVVATDEQQ